MRAYSRVRLIIREKKNIFLKNSINRLKQGTERLKFSEESGKNFDSKN